MYFLTDNLGIEPGLLIFGSLCVELPLLLDFGKNAVKGKGTGISPAQCSSLGAQIDANKAQELTISRCYTISL